MTYSKSHQPKRHTCPYCGKQFVRARLEDIALEFIGSDVKTVNDITIHLMNLGFAPGSVATRLPALVRQGLLVATVQGYKKP